MVHTSAVFGTLSCPVYLILCVTSSLPFITLLNVLLTQSVQRLLVVAPTATHQAISQPSPLCLSFVVSQIYPTCTVQDNISFTVLMDLFLLASFEYLLSLSLLPVVLALRNPLASSFLLLDTRMGGVSLSLVCSL
jgi:hypothetical protein